MPWPLYLALKQLFPTGRRFPFFTFMSVTGVALGVAILIIVLSVMNGFGSQIRRTIVDAQGHILVMTGRPMKGYEAVMEKIEALPGVAAAAPFIQGPCMMQFGDRPAFPQVFGIDPVREPRTTAIEQFAGREALDQLDDDSVLISSDLSNEMGAYPGDEVEIISPLLLERLQKDEILLPRRFRVVGRYQTGWNQIDGNTLIVTLRTMQDLYGLEGLVHGIKVRVDPGVDVDDTVAEIKTALGPPFRAVSWLDSNRDFMFVLQLEKNMLFFLLLFIVLVAAFAIASSLLITVVRKTREIGLIAALGGRSRDIALSFCVQGLYIGIAGTAAGFALAFAVLAVRNDIIHFFTRLTNSEAAMVRFYQFSNLPAESAGRDLVVIAIASVIISTLAGVLPAWRAARMRPSEALRSE